MTVLKIFQEVEAQHIGLFSYPISFTDAATICLDGQYAIFMDFSQFKTVAECNAALAHETGHCATGATHHISSKYDLIEKHEYTANRWAFEHYLPFDELKTAMHAGLTEPWQLAEWYDFPESFIRKALSYYTESRGFNLEDE